MAPSAHCAQNLPDASRNCLVHLAIRDGNANAAIFLLRSNCAVDSQNLTGETPLHLAASKNMVAVVSLLLERKALTNVQDAQGRTPLHLAIAEQLQIDQPSGIRAAFETLAARHGEGHAALHDILDCLGETLWRAQRDRAPPDGAAYLECMQRAAAR